MNETILAGRRGFLRRFGHALFVFCAGRAVRAAVSRASDGESGADAFAAALRREVGNAELESSDRIALSLPAVAEDGALVPASLESLLPGTDRLVLLAEKNPFPLVVAFDFGSAVLPFVTLRVKLNASGDVVALARAKGRYYMTRRVVRVVVGGCG